MKRFINPNILNEGNQMEVIQDNENEFKISDANYISSLLREGTSLKYIY